MSVAGAGGEETPLPACDFCAGLPAVVYCRADSARLCLPCDRYVHGANTVSTRHARAPLCAACRSAAAAFRRSAAGCGGGCLCADCDFEEGHRRDGDPPPLHDRRAVEVYAGCPSIAELAAVLGVGGRKKATTVAGDGNGVGWWPDWEELQVLRLEDVIVPTTSCHGLQPLLAPSSAPKHRSSGGKLAEEVIRQLGELAKSEAAAEAAEAEQFPSWASSEYGIGDGDFEVFHNKAASMSVPSCEQEAWMTTDDSNGACGMAHDAAHDQAPAAASSPAEPSLSSFVAMSEICPSMAIGNSVGDVVDNGSSKRDAAEATAPRQHAAPAPAKKAGYDVAYPDRGTVISRYKEKRKNRRFDKQIRYESRKARADGRLRIKGRFARSGEAS
ncbi:hypothetical protein SETIT_2G423300v2 [Setaria italica]|uniref:CCT domain-containing protein n=1 Tax=Setaria italica TaxID=4555 RepID=A0A368Q8T6_SETIT|nr:zinc finger protein CONSTANS-LIKE 13 isoform X1 [Setaria italica]RCV14405.1 hypothetical protein SETIT_2G423300v2 [Setaria italica]